MNFLHVFQSIAMTSQVTSVIDHAAPTAHRAPISGLEAAQADIERIRSERKATEAQLRQARTAHGDRLSELAGIRAAAQATMDIVEADQYAEQVQRLVAHAEAAEKVVQGWNDQVRKLQTQEREAENRLHELQRRVANLKTVELPVRRENVVRAAQRPKKYVWTRSACFSTRTIWRRVRMLRLRPHCGNTRNLQVNLMLDEVLGSGLG